MRHLPEEIEVKILWRMYRHHFIGGKHTSIDNLKKGFEKSAYGDVDMAIDNLIKQGFILVKPTSYGKQVSLNPKMLGVAKQKIDGFIPSSSQ